jgi:hypothetical protein
MSEWQPIETAPKDLATDVIVWGVSRIPNGSLGSKPEWLIVFWYEDAWCIKYSDELGGNDEYVYCTVPNPVAWMPLPAPPVEVKEDEQGT